MEYYQSISNLKNLIFKSLNNTISTDEVSAFVTELNARDDFNDVESNYYCMVIASILSKTLDKNNYLHSLLIDEITIKLILNSVADYNAKASVDECKCDQPITSKKSETEETTQSDEKTSNKLDIETIKEIVLKEFPSFPPSENPGLTYPPEGRLNNVQVQDYVAPDGVTYSLSFLVDHDGIVQGLEYDPIPQRTAMNFEEIYNNLAGQLMEFQKA